MNHNSRLYVYFILTVNIILTQFECSFGSDTKQNLLKLKKCDRKLLLKWTKTHSNTHTIRIFESHQIFWICFILSAGDGKVLFLCFKLHLISSFRPFNFYIYEICVKFLTLDIDNFFFSHNFSPEIWLNISVSGNA